MSKRSRKIELHRLQELLILLPSNDVSFLPSSIIFIHDHVFLSVKYIFRMFVFYFILLLSLKE